MPDRVTRRSLLASSLQVLKCAFKSRRSRSGNMNAEASHSNRTQDTLSESTINEPICPPPNTPRSPLSATETSSSASTPTKKLRSVRGERIRRAVMLSSDTADAGKPSTQAEEEGQGHLGDCTEELISVSQQEEERQPLILHETSFPDSHRAEGEKAHYANYSRLPTPVKPPTSNLYSHEMYQHEGRRSVLSSLGAPHTAGKRYGGGDLRSGSSEDGPGVCSRSNSMHDGRTGASEQKPSGLPLPQRGHSSERVQLRRTNILPASTRDHGSSKPDNARKSLPVVVTGRPSRRVLSRKEVSHSRAEMKANPNSSSSSDLMSTHAADAPRPCSGEHHTDSQQFLRLIPIEDNIGLGLQMQAHDHHSDATPTSEAELARSSLGALPRRVRLTNKFENLRAQNDKKEKQSGEAAVQSFLKLN
ncbi:similar to An14g00450 [Aspergillus luchuensis]|nr:similar to An14g00450 [Aspergillus luchuensis]